MNAAQNTTVLNKLKRLFGGGNDLSGLTARVDALEARASNIEALAMGYDVAVFGEFIFTFSVTDHHDMDLEVDRFSNVGNIELEINNTMLPAGCSIISNTILGNRERWRLAYDGTGNAGIYPTQIAFIADNFMVIKNIVITINP